MGLKGFAEVLDPSRDLELGLFMSCWRRLLQKDSEYEDLLPAAALARTITPDVIGALRRRPTDRSTNQELFESIMATPFVNRDYSGSLRLDADIRSWIINSWYRTDDHHPIFLELNERLRGFYLERYAALTRVSEFPRQQQLLPGHITNASLDSILEALYHASLASLDKWHNVFELGFTTYEQRRDFQTCEVFLERARVTVSAVSLRSYESEANTSAWFLYWEARLRRGQLAFLDAKQAAIRALALKGIDEHLKSSAYAELGAATAHLRQFAESHEAFGKVLEAVGRGGDVTASMWALGERLPWWDQYVSHFDRVVEASRLGIQSSSDRVATEAWVYCAQSAVGNRSGFGQRAKEHAVRSLACTRVVPRLEATALLLLAEADIRAYKYDSAVPNLDSARRIFEQERLEWDLARCLTIHGVLQYRLSQFAEGIALCASGERLYRSAENYAGVGRCLKLAGDCSLRLARVEESRALYNQAFDVFGRAKHPVGLADSLLGLAETNMRFRDFTTASEHLGQALRLYRGMRQQIGEANCLKSLAEIALLQQSYDQALEYIGQALNTFRSGKYRLGEANCRRLAAEIRLRQGDRGKALDLFSSVRELCSQLNDGLGVANCDLGLARLAVTYEEARTRVDSVIRWYQSHGLIRNVGLAMGELAAITANHRNLADANRICLEAIALLERYHIEEVWLMELLSAIRAERLDTPTTVFHENATHEYLM